MARHLSEAANTVRKQEHRYILRVKLLEKNSQIMMLPFVVRFPLEDDFLIHWLNW